MQTIRLKKTMQKMQTIDAQGIEAEDLDRVVKALEHLPNSDLVHQLQQILRSVRDGFDLKVIKQDSMLTPNEAADMLRVSRPHVMALIKRGELHSEIVGKRNHHIPLTEIVDLMSRKERASKDVATALAHRDSSKRALIAQSAGVDAEIAASLGY